MRLPVDRTGRLVLASLLCGAALALSLMDSYISSFIPLPGFKFGLANVVSLFALYSLGFPTALAVLLVRSAAVAVMSGNITSILFALAGGMASLVLSYFLVRRISVIKVSVCGAVTHNVVQTLVASVITVTPEIFYYLPPLVVAGAVSGFVMGVASDILLRRLLPSSLCKAGH